MPCDYSSGCWIKRIQVSTGTGTFAAMHWVE